MTPPGFSVLIPDGESGFTLFVVHGLINFPQVKLHVLSGQRWVPARFSRYCHRYTFSKLGPEASERFGAIAELVTRHHIDVVLPVELEWIALQDDQRRALAELVAIAPVPDSTSFRSANNKWLLFQVLQSQGILAPPTVLCTLDGDFERQVRNLEFPVLLKPVVAWGGENIRRFDHISQLYQFLEQCDSEKIKDKYIVQRFLTGYVVGLNVLAQEGRILAYTMQRGFIPNSQEYAAAAAIRFIKRDDVLEVGQKLISALQYSGVMNVDMFYDTRENQIKVLEVNARFWGSLRGSYMAGVSFPYLACLAGLGIPTPFPDYELTRYVHPRAALVEGMLSILKKNRYERFSFEETGLRYLLADPVAESLRAFRQYLS